MKYLLCALIRFYQRFLSPLKGRPMCRFRPTCSSYAIGVISEWGALAGSFLAAWRILRCNPFCKGGFDPVPKRVIRPRKMRREEFDPFYPENNR